MVKGDWIKKNAIVIDVGINRIEVEIEGKIKNKHKSGRPGRYRNRNGPEKFVLVLFFFNFVVF